MVYNSFSSFFDQCLRYYQQDCLLCGCPIKPSLPEHSSVKHFALCPFCYQQLPLIQHACALCALPVQKNTEYCGQCLSRPPWFDSSYCAVSYEAAIPQLIHKLKHNHDNSVKKLLSELLLTDIMNVKHPIDIVTAVPMHWRRNLLLNNNHSQLLADVICRKLQLPQDNKLLQRIKHSPVQKTLNAKQRRKNLKGAFQLSTTVKDMRIAVIDDVITTGSTMNEIAKTLKQAGAKEVHCWAIARTPKH